MVVVLGMAGSGKSTQCTLLSKNGSYQWLAVGELLRNIQTGDNRAEMLRGMVLSDQVVKPIVKTEIIRLKDNPEILLDGCPRTVSQAEWLASAIETPPVRCVLHLVVDDGVAISRLLSRGREDDSESAIQARLDGYHRDIGPVLDQFSRCNIPIHQINGSDEVNKVNENIRLALAK